MYNPCEKLETLQEFIAGIKIQTFYYCIEGIRSSEFRLLGTLVSFAAIGFIAWKLTKLISSSND